MLIGSLVIGFLVDLVIAERLFAFAAQRVTVVTVLDDIKRIIEHTRRVELTRRERELETLATTLDTATRLGSQIVATLRAA
jgi:hypothetical protein